MFLATKPMRIGERDVLPGDPAPEVADFEPQVIRRLLNTNYVIYDPAVVAIPPSGKEDARAKRQPAQ